MSAETDKSNLLAEALPGIGVLTDAEVVAVRAALAVLAPFAWALFAKYQFTVLYSRRVLFWTLDVTVASFLPFMVKLFGPQPVATR